MNKGQHEFTRYWDVPGGRVIDCLTCGFKHVYPLPDRQQLLEMYGKNYFRQIKSFPYESIDDDYVERRSAQVASQRGYIEVYEKVVELLGKSASDSGVPKMMDVGCGNDLLSLHFKQRDWRVSVLEPNQDAANYLRKYDIPVFEQFADDEGEFPARGLSFINMQFMLEHVIDPRRILEKAYRALVPGGIIRVAVPNDFSEGQLAYQEYYKESYRWIHLPDHVNYFSYADLSKLLARSGFREAYRTTNFPLEFLLLGGMNYYDRPEEQKKVGPFVANFQKAMIETGRIDLLRKLYDSLAQLNMGRSIYMYGIKEQ